jgi:hypothetical protein
LVSNFSKETILQNKDLPWDWNTFYFKKDYNDIDLVQEFPDYKWDWDTLSAQVFPQLIFKNKMYPWNWDNFSMNYNLKISDVINHPEVQWNWTKLTSAININDILNHQELPWILDSSLYGIGSNPTLTTEFIVSHIDIQWKWHILIWAVKLDYDYMLKSNVNWGEQRFELLYYKTLRHVTRDAIPFILKYKQNFDTGVIFHDTIAFHKSGVITMEDILNYPELIFSYHALSNNPNLQLWYIKKHINEEWNYENIFANKAFSNKDLEEISEILPKIYIYTFLSTEGWSLNPNLTYEYIWKNLNIYEWNFDKTLQNHFTLEINRKNIVQKLENKYSIRKNKRIFKLLKKDVIPDLSRIIVEY